MIAVGSLSWAGARQQAERAVAVRSPHSASAAGNSQIDLRAVQNMELTLTGPACVFPFAGLLRAVEAGELRLSGIVAHHFDVNEKQRALDIAFALNHGAAGYAKVCEWDQIGVLS